MRVIPAVRILTQQRDGGWCIRRHPDGRKRAADLHHRRTAAMGGSTNPYLHLPGNLVWLCSVCHLWITDMVDRPQAEHEGLYLFQGGPRPDQVPVLWQGQWVYLLNDGTTGMAKEPAA